LQQEQVESLLYTPSRVFWEKVLAWQIPAAVRNSDKVSNLAEVDASSLIIEAIQSAV
jgi:hypothetical protein